MANGPALSTAKGGEIYVGGELRHPFLLLDILYANQFEGETFDSQFLDQTEENFYRGAPPKWLNFHISEQAQSGGTGTPLIKRDGYDQLVEQIHQRRKRPGTSNVKLLHQPGCGGTTLAMQVMWDLKKTFRCAVLKGSLSVANVTDVANEVVQLFTAGRRGHQNTVLLLVNDEQLLESLQDSIMMKIAEQKIGTRMPVAIFFSCVRKDAVEESDRVFLQQALSDREKKEFNDKKEMLSKRYADSRRHEKFHGFNIMQSNFSEDYVKEACKESRTVQKKNKPKSTQLAAFLSLLNAYVPGSYLLESQCLDFLKHKNLIHGDCSLETRMERFSDLIVTFQQDVRHETRVRMAHPMIAQCCIKLMAKAGVTRSDTARNLLTNLCRDEVPPFLLGFVKDMLTKREIKRNQSPPKDDKERFSGLILKIQKKEGNKECASVLKVASNKFDQNPFFPQALARCYYIELKYYNLAEMWAKRAKQREPKNSFIADTLGQVYKNHLQSKGNSARPREILQIAAKAIEAFKHEEHLAENEQGTDMAGDCTTQVSHVFNNRGKFGYVQVCNHVYDLLVKYNEIWRGVLKKNVSMGSVLELLGDNKLFRFHDLLKSLRGEVEKKREFFDRYLTCSKPGRKKEDPPYLYSDISDCYSKYGGVSPDFIQKLERNLAVTSSQMMPLSPTDAPESHLIALLLNWPADSEGECVFDLSQFIQRMHSSYRRAYETYFRSRYLCPLFFIGNGQDLSRIVSREVLPKELFTEPNEETQDWHNNWSDKKLLKNGMVQERLLKVDGSVQNHRVYAHIGDKKIEMEANLRNSLWKNRQVSFYLGFTIKGPVAFGIVTKSEPAEEEMDNSKSEEVQPGPPAQTDTTGA